jgi:hypothetical protein
MGRAPSIAAAAGEHFVAARLSAMGLVVGIPRGGSPAIDLLVSSPEGRHPLGVQVKTATNARYDYKRRKRTTWSWPMKLQEVRTLVWHVFVDLQNWPNAGSGVLPVCYVLSPKDMIEYGRLPAREGWSMGNLYLVDGVDDRLPDASRFREKWDGLLATVVREEVVDQ